MLVVAGLSPVAPAQLTAEPDALERYLAERGLDEVLATHLRDRMLDASSSDRRAIASRLADIYVRQLNETSDVAALADLERRCRELLRIVPDAETSELRINLARARYLGAQQVAERTRLRMTEPDEVVQASEVLRATSGELERLATSLHRRVEALERELRKPNADEIYIRSALEEGRRLRSLAFYYAGWSDYYLALLTARASTAGDATRRLGWILGADGRVPAPDQIQPAMLRFEHVGRSAIGCALAESLKGEHVRAVRWLETLATTTELHPSVADQTLMAQAVVFTAAQRWADLLSLVERERARRDEPFEPTEARLIAVLTLDRLGERASLPGRDAIVEAIAQVALADLVQTGQIGHVLDLVTQFGTLPLGDRGFIVRYARALQSYQRAREAHGSDAPNTPTADATVATLYRQAAEALAAATSAEDAAGFAAQRDQAETLRGLAHYLAGDAAMAADVLEAAARAAESDDKAEEALWYAIVAIDDAIERGAPSLKPRRLALAQLYLTRHPASSRAARLILTSSGDEVISPEEAVEVLLGLPPDDALYGPAQRQVARLLYAIYRRSTGEARDAAALRFADRAEAVLALTQRELPTANADRVEQLSAAATLLVRQLLDALLALNPPDIDRARQALVAIEEIAPFASETSDELRSELAYRELQIAVATGDEMWAERALSILRETPESSFARAATQLLFRDAVSRFDRSPSDADLAARVVRFGTSVLDQLRATGAAIGDTQTLPVAEATARAAASADDADIRAIGLELDRSLRDASAATADGLRRIASATEATDPAEALDAWRRLLAALRPPELAWYEARHESIRLLALINPAEAREAFDQHALLYPELGPAPWGDRLRELGLGLPAADVLPNDGVGGNP